MFFAMWLKARIDDFNPDKVTTIACYRNEKIGMVVGFSNPHYNRIEMCWACDDPHCVTKGNILSMMSPAFLPPMSANAITAVTTRNNRRCRKFLKGIGFIEEGVIRQASPNKSNLIHYGLLKSEYLELVKKFRPQRLEMAKEWVNGR